MSKNRKHMIFFNSITLCILRKMYYALWCSMLMSATNHAHEYHWFPPTWKNTQFLQIWFCRYTILCTYSSCFHTLWFQIKAWYLLQQVYVNIKPYAAKLINLQAHKHLSDYLVFICRILSWGSHPPEIRSLQDSLQCKVLDYHQHFKQRFHENLKKIFLPISKSQIKSHDNGTKVL